MEWVQVRLPIELYQQIKAIIDKQQYWVNEHEFIRDAVREKLDRLRTEQKEVS